ncbi:MAG: hypothetical protein WC389_17145 [Lutibacter sp.]|jgi:hypothetical protein
MKILRVFPRKTNATPVDENVRFEFPGMFDEADEVHISVSFTYDLPYAEILLNQWKHIAPTKIGGPATGEKGGEFTPGMYLKNGLTITSRGCNNHCWFCSVWKREGKLRELEIKSGWNIMDDNLLSCSDQHILSVFEMLKNQNHAIVFTGGLEAKLLKEWHVFELAKLKPKYLYFAYDTPDDMEPLINAGKLLKDYGFNHQLMCYVLIGYPKDTFYLAEKRLKETCRAGFQPFAMLYRNENGEVKSEWRRFQREWTNPVITGFKMKQLKPTKI